MSANDGRAIEKRQSKWNQVNWVLLGFFSGVIAFWIILIRMIASALGF
jgi:hypothetical protein